MPFNIICCPFLSFRFPLSPVVHLLCMAVCVGVAPRCVCVMPEKKNETDEAHMLRETHIANVNTDCNQALGEHISFVSLWLIGKY